VLGWVENASVFRRREISASNVVIREYVERYPAVLLSRFMTSLLNLEDTCE
jgi:hypothetical protein